MKLLSLLLLCALGQFAYGQYYYIPDAGPFDGSLNIDPAFPQGSGQAPGWTSLLGPSVSAPTWSADQALPFAFNFNGSPVTDYKVSSNGVLTFDLTATAVPGNTPAALPDASIPNRSLCAWGLVASGGNDHVSTKMFGSAPNRQLWIHYSSCANGSIGWSYWSIVLEEGSDMIYFVDQRNTTGTGALSVGIQVNATEAYSVTDSPALGSISGSDATDADDYHYAFFQGTQPMDEVALTDFGLLPYVAVGTNDIVGTVKNLGVNTITSLDLEWNDGSGAQTATLNGLSIATNQTYDFTHTTPLNATTGSAYNIDLTATIANDSDPSNNSISKPTVTLSSIPDKYVVGEEKTGTWCGWCPRGAVALAGMESESKFIGIAVHNGDPMTIASYDGSIGTYVPGGYPGGGVDRVTSGNPATFDQMFASRASVVVPCSVNDITATYVPATNVIQIATDVEFYGNIAGNYRVSAIIVENDVLGDGTASWNQTNYYDGGASGLMTDPVTSFEWSTAGDPVNPNDFGGYDHVARYLSNDQILGDVNSLPSGTVSEGSHSHTFADAPASVVDDYTKCHVVVIIVNADNGEILNAGIESINLTDPLSVEEYTGQFSMSVFPSPANEFVYVALELANGDNVTYSVIDATGRTVIAPQTSFVEGKVIVNLSTAELNSGMYYVRAISGSKATTKPLQIIK